MKMPYELSVEEIRLYVSPLVGAGNDMPKSNEWIKRWVLINAKLVTYDGIGSFVVSGLRKPFDAQVEIRRVMPPDMGGAMPRCIGDFAVRDTVFMVTKVPPGKPPEDSSRLPVIATALVKLDRLFRKEWGDRPLPDGISTVDFDFEKLIPIGKRIPGIEKQIGEIVETMAKWPFERLTEYASGLIHGDPGVDNAFLFEDRVVFADGPCETGPELVDVAYLMQSAAACMDNFEMEPTAKALAEFYEKPTEEMRRDLILADAVAHAMVIRWFDRCSTELLPDYVEAYDHLIAERIDCLSKLVKTKAI